jgi:DNA invertase Pin-like site-specific DNA recombinase
MAVVKGRRVDVVVVAAFDRFGRSVRHLVDTLELFPHLDVEFISLREQIDTGSPLGQAVSRSSLRSPNWNGPSSLNE